MLVFYAFRMGGKGNQSVRCDENLCLTGLIDFLCSLLSNFTQNFQLLVHYEEFQLISFSHFVLYLDFQIHWSLIQVFFLNFDALKNALLDQLR